jgi:hypothetical protein
MIVIRQDIGENAEKLCTIVDTFYPISLEQIKQKVVRRQKSTIRRCIWLEVNEVE